MYIRGDVGGQAIVPRQGPRQSVLHHHRAIGNTARRRYPDYRERECMDSRKIVDADLELTGSCRPYALSNRYPNVNDSP